VSFAIEKGWCEGEDDFDFARCYSEPIYTRFSDAHTRQVCTISALSNSTGKITPELMIEMLRSHSVQRTENWRPDSGITGADVCMHSGWGPIRLSQTTGSLVTHNTENLSTHWVTATASPCTSIFKPVWLDTGIPDTGSSPTGEFDLKSLFWRHELVHRRIIENYPERIGIIRNDISEVENSFFLKSGTLFSGSFEDRKTFSFDCFKKSDTLEREWSEKINKHPIRNKNRFLYRLAWRKTNQAARFPD
jgi:dipeptidase